MLSLFRSKVAMALLGMIIFGVGGALFVLAPPHISFPQAQTSQAHASATSAPKEVAQPKETTFNGSVRSVGSHSFVIRTNGIHVTINVTSQTIYRGAATSLSTMIADMNVTVRALKHADGSYWAISVDTSVGDT